MRIPHSGPALELPCQMQTVNVGSNCKCSGENYIKSISVPGYILACQPFVRNPSGDAFTVTFMPSADALGSQLTATRYDSNSCWCDNTLNVQCCIVPPAALT